MCPALVFFSSDSSLTLGSRDSFLNKLRPRRGFFRVRRRRVLLEFKVWESAMTSSPPSFSSLRGMIFFQLPLVLTTPGFFFSPPFCLSTFFFMPPKKNPSMVRSPPRIRLPAFVFLFNSFLEPLDRRASPGRCARLVVLVRPKFHFVDFAPFLA